MIFKDVEGVINFCQIEFNFQEYRVGDFHRKTDLAYSTIHRLTRGETKSPHLRTIIRFLAGLGYKLETHDPSKKKGMKRIVKKTIRKKTSRKRSVLSR